MTKHDTWVRLREGTPFDSYQHLFPNGIPMRDPFAMGWGDNGRESMPLWITDMERLSSQQCDAIAAVIAAVCHATPQEVFKEALETGGFGIRNQWIGDIRVGPEGLQRGKELADFMDSVPMPPSAEAWMEFVSDQRRKWIDGDEVPPPLPETLEDIDPRLRTRETTVAILENKVAQRLSNYSALDILTGQAAVDILNEIDPTNTWSLVGADDEEDDVDYDEYNDF